jgi:probable HAF family extracellular repeat protein
LNEPASFSRIKIPFAELFLKESSMRYLKRWQLAIVCLIALLLPPVFPVRHGKAQAVNYTVTDLGTLGGAQSRAYGIDECGRVVGEATLASAPNSNPHPFFWNDGQMTDMGTLNGSSGTANAINALGFAAGAAAHAFIWSAGGGQIDIGALPGGAFAAANDINDTNQVVGVSEINQFTNRSFLWQQSTGMQELPTLGGATATAYGINNAGQIVGTAAVPSGDGHAFLLSGGVMNDLGTLAGGRSSVAHEISEDGHVVGYSFLPSPSANVPFHGFIWSSATGMMDMGTLNGSSQSIAYDINSAGQAVGTSQVALGDDHAFIYTVATGMTDLHDLTPGSGWTLREARAINDRGQIVGFGVNPSGQTHGFLLTPDNVTPSPCSQAGSFQFSSATYSVSEAGTKRTITVNRVGGIGGAVSVDYATSDGSATLADSDYTAASGTLNFAEGETSKTFDVSVTNDNTFEQDETVNLTLSNPQGGATLGAQSTATLTITNDDAAPSVLQFSAATYNIGENGPTATITVTRTGGSTAVSVSYATTDGTATAGQDYTATSGTLNFAAGDNEETFTVPITDDNLDETDETVNLTLSNPTNGATLGSPGTAVLTITDNDAQPSFTIGDVTLDEGNSATTSFTFTVTKSGSTSLASSVGFATADGTATTAGGDYQSNTGTLDFAANETTKTITVPVNGDTVFETNETFFVNLSGATNATISDPQALGTITNDDAAPTLSVNDVTQAEGDTGTTAFTFTVTKSGATELTASADFATADGTATTADNDYQSNSGSVSFAANETTKTITVTVNGDVKFEANEDFFVNLSNLSDATAADGQGKGTITNEDAPGAFQFSAPTYSVGENGTTATITVTRTGGSSGAASVNFATSNGTATAGQDYTATSGTLNFANGETQKSFTVAITEDTLDEADETVNLTLSNPTNDATLGAQSTATLTINDNDATPTLQFSAPTYSVGEGVTTATITVTRTGGSNAVSVAYATSDGTATAGQDYTATSGTLNFAAGDNEETFTVPITEDSVDETDESLNLLLSPPQGGAVLGSPATAILTIIDNDGAPSFSIGDVTQAEGNAGTTTFTFTVSKSGATALPVSVDFATADGTATTADGDYQSNGGPVTFAPNEATKQITVTVNGDAKLENDEDFLVNLSNQSGATINDGQGKGTITNDDAPPAFSIDDVTHAEGNSGTTAYTFTVTKSGTTVLPSSVSFATQDGTATTAGGDYQSNSNTLNFTASDTTKTITVLVNGDTTPESNETFFVNLSGAVNASVSSDSQGVGTISNDDASLSISDVTVTEGNSGTVNAAFNVSIAFATVNTVTVSFATADGTATTASGDYAPNSNTLTFNPGVTTQTVNVTVNGDTVFETNETFAVNLSNPSGATISDSQGTGTITNDDAAPTLSINALTHDEGNAGTTAFTFTVTKSGATQLPASADFATADGTATTVDGDYQAISGTVSFAANETIPKTITVLVNGDTKFESAEDFFVNLSNLSGATFVGGQGKGTITNDDNAPVAGSLQFSSATYSNVGESGTTTITVTRTGGSDGAVSVDFATSNGTATAVQDYTATSGTLNFADGDAAQKTFTVSITDDTLDEANETVGLTLSNPTGGAGIGTPNSAVLTITDNDATPTVSVNDVALTEGDAGTQNLTFTVTLSAVSGQNVSVHVATADSSATAGSDYDAVPDATVNIPAGSTTATFNVAVRGDTIDEPDETFLVNLSNPSNATISDGQGVGTINDNDAAPSLSVNDVAVTEGNSGTVIVAFNVTLSAASGKTVTVAFNTADGTATTAGGDYATASGTLTFNPGEVSKNFNVNVIGDTIDEPNETFLVNLSGATNASLADSQGQGTITDDDGAPSLNISDVTVTEGNSGTTNAVFTVSLLPASGQTVTVNFATANITATAGSDYNSVSGTLTFNPGDTAKTITVPVIGDTVNEADESFLVNLSGETNASVADSQGVGLITNDDAPQLQFSEAIFAADESLHLKVITVTRTGDASLPVTVDYLTSDGTASQRNDYTFGFGTLRFAAGETSKTFELLLTDDAYQEGDETVNLALLNPTGGAILGSQSTATASIAANDPPPMGPNPIDASPFFVRMHYHDFFGRSPDQAGLNFWVNNIEGCGANAQCREVKRIDTSAAFYLSIEFQETGFLVERVYKTAFGDATGTSTFGGPHTLPVPIVRFGEFLPDARKVGEGVIIGNPGAEALLEANKNAFVLEFVQRQRFTDNNNYPLTLTPAAVVDKMNERAGGVLTQAQRDALVAQLANSSNVTAGRASVLRQIAENATLKNNETNRAFVLMQFFGYLRRNPNDPQDVDYTGFDFWLQKLNQFSGDFRRAEMVKSFIISTEYRERFGKP